MDLVFAGTKRRRREDADDTGALPSAGRNVTYICTQNIYKTSGLHGHIVDLSSHSKPDQDDKVATPGPGQYDDAEAPEADQADDVATLRMSTLMDVLARASCSYPARIQPLPAQLRQEQATSLSNQLRELPPYQGVTTPSLPHEQRQSFTNHSLQLVEMNTSASLLCTGSSLVSISESGIPIWQMDAWWATAVCDEHA